MPHSRRTGLRRLTAYLQGKRMQVAAMVLVATGQAAAQTGGWLLVRAAIDNGIAGSPRTVRDFVAAEIEATGGNYFVSWLAFGDMTLAESLRSLALFSREVMPAFAPARADAAQ